MSDFQDALKREYQQRKQEEEANNARWRLTPEGQLPTSDFTDAPATAHAVNVTPEPQSMQKEWDDMAFYEKVWNSGAGGFHNLQKGEVVQDIIGYAMAKEKGILGSLEEDLEERFENEEDRKKFEVLRGSNVDEDYIKEQDKNLNKAIRRFEELSVYDKDYKTPDVVLKASKATEGKSFIDSIAPFLSEFAKDPLNYSIYLFGSSTGAIAPSLLMSMGSGVAVGRFLKMKTTARAIQSALMGYGSYNAEVGSYIMNEWQEKGYDLRDAESVKKALATENLGDLRTRAMRRAATVGLFDAFSAWIAPMRLNPSNALRYLKTNAAKATTGLVAPTSRAIRFAKGMENLTLQTSLQGFMGGAGEAFGQLVNGEEINWGEVFAEAIGEFTSAPFEVLGLSWSVNSEFNRDTANYKQAQEFFKNENDIVHYTAAVANKIGDNQTVEQWAEGVGKETQLFAFAQDLVDQKIPDKIRETNPELAEKIEKAAQEKQDITLSMSDVLKTAVTDEATAKAMVHETRLTADGMSQRQAEEFAKNGKKEAIEKFQKIIDKAQPDIERRKQIDTIVDKIEDQLVKEGVDKDVAHASSMPWRSRIAVLSNQLNETPEQTMARLGDVLVRRERGKAVGFTQALSTALPSEAALNPKGKNKEPLYQDPQYVRLWADYQEAKKNPKWFENAIKRLLPNKGLKRATEGAQDLDSMGEKIIQHIVDNLVFLYNKMPENLRNRSKLWYEGGRRAAEVFATRYGLRPRQTAAIIAIFSPQTDWFANMSFAERLLDIYFSARRQKADQAMLDWFNTEEGKKHNRSHVEGKTLEELVKAGKFEEAATWVRAYDKAHNPVGRNTLTPEGGVAGRDLNKDGTESVTSFMASDRLEKSLSVIVDGSVENIDKQIGKDFKVRDFYNNIYNPSNPNATTIDTHAVGAGLFSVVSGKSQVVLDNFKNPGNATSGQKGLYPIFFEAYRRAAEQLGVLPREVQSIVWEGIRALFEGPQKDSLRPKVEAIWERADNGEITADQAREEIFNLAGGFSETAWQNVPVNPNFTETYDRSHVKLYDDIVQPEPEPALSLEVAPNPNDQQAVAQWDQLTDESKLSVTQAIVPWVVEQVALLTKTHIDLPKLQRGGYEGTPNYSMSCELEEGSNSLLVAQLLATVLRQESIMLVSTTQEQGTEASKLIRIKLPEGYTTDQIDSLYNALDGVRDANGERLITGHSSFDGVMTISADPAKIEEIEKGLTKALAGYEGDLIFKVNDGYVGFIKSLEEEKNATSQNDPRRGEAVRQGASVPNYDNLRQQTDERVAGLIQEKLKEQQAQKLASGQEAFAQGLTSLLLQSTRPNRGYRGNKSNRALRAEALGGKPWSKWTKKNLLAQIEYEYGDSYPEVVEAARTASVDALKELVLENQEWHHVGSNYRATAYFFVRDLHSKSEAEELIKNLQGYEKKPSQVVSATIDGKTYTGVLTGATFRYVDADGKLRINTLSRRGDWDMASFAKPVTNEAEAERTREKIAQLTPSPKTKPKKMRFAKIRTKDGNVHYAKVYDNKLARLVPKSQQDKWRDVEDTFNIGTDAEIVEEMTEDNRLQFASDILDLKIDFAEQRKKAHEEKYDRYDANSQKVDPSHSKKWNEDNYRYWSKFADREAERIEDLENRIKMLKRTKEELGTDEEPRFDLLALLQLAYHGSPYRFDKFSLEHIGNGEGAQVHGWGLYFALNRAVAEAYQKNLAHNEDYKYYPDKELFEKALEELKIEEKKLYDKLSQLYSDIKDPEERASAMAGVKQELFVVNDKQTVLRQLSKTSDVTTVIECLDGFKWLSNEAKNWIRTEIISKLKKEKQSTIYTVDIPEDDVMLREDASFNNQPKKVQKAIKELWESINSSGEQKKRLKEWVDSLATIAEGNLPPDTADALVALAEKEGPDFFYRSQADKVLKALMPAIKIDAEEIYKNNKEYYDRNGEYEGTTGLELATNDLVEDLMYSGWLTWPSREWMNKFKPALEDYKGARGWEIYRRLSTYLGGDMQASLMLNKFGVQGIRYNGRRDGECAVVFDDTTIKIVDMLNQLAYHGTGVEKDILKFTLEHIGEGEGAQAHGYGLYFALLQQVARGYKDKLSNGAYQVQGENDTEFRMQLERSANSLKGDERKKAFDRLTAYDEWYANHNVEDVKKAYERGEITEDAYKWFNKEVAPNVTSSGGLYLVDIPEDNVMLHETEVFEDQPAEVQEAIRKLFKNEFSAEQLNKFYHEQWYNDAMDQMQDYSYTFSVPDTVLRALDKLAKEEGPKIFADEKKVLKKISGAIDEAVEAEYEKDKDWYDDVTKEEALKKIRERIIEEAGLNADGIFDTLHLVAEENYPSLLADNVEFELSNTVHGFQIYNKIAELTGSRKEASALLNKYGVKGIRYTGLEDGECAVVWDEDSIKILERLQQLGEQAGPEKIRGSYLPRNTAQQYRQSVITLMECYDKSTFLHESAHAWLDLDTMIASDLADKIDRGEELTEGEQAFMRNLGGFFKWGQQEGVINLGVTDDIKTVAQAARKWAKMDSAQQRGMHELFAEGFEAYLMEGIAPNKELKSLFETFKKWLIDVYSKLVRQPRPISKEVRKLYDLMFATEQQAEETQVRLGLHAMFDVDMAKQLGMTDEEIKKYQELEKQATAETAGLVAKKVHGAMRIFGRVRKEEARRLENERKKEIKEREEKRLREPRFRALSMLNSNKVKISKESLKSFGLSDETIALYEERNWVSEDGGVSLHVLASTVGTEDVRGLLCDLVDIERMSDAHEEAIREIAWEESVEHEGEGDFRELQANLCAYNETRSRLLTAEFNAIMRKLGGQQLMVQAAREYALNYISGIKVSDLHEKAFMAAERRCAKDAETAFRKGDFNAVVEAKRAQILNHELARAALEAKDRYERGKRAARSALKSKTVHPFYKRIIDSLMEAHSVSTMTAEERQKFAVGETLSAEEIDKIEETLYANGTPIEGVAKLLRDRKHTQEMTVGEANEFFAYVKQVAKVGRNVLKLSKIKEGQRVDETNAQLEAQLEESAKAQGRERKTNLHEPQTGKQRRKKSLMSFLMGNVKVSAICKIFDGNKHGGIFWEVFIKPANECATFEAEQRKRASEWLRDKLLPAFRKNMDEDPIMIDGFEEPMTHGMRMAVALNLGNESNRQRLVQNDPRFTDEAIQQILDTLTEADWRAIEAVWQLFESFRPMIAAKQLRVYGVEPEWIEYEPFQVRTKEGKTITVSGGYYPVVYDYEASDVAGQLQEAKDAERMMQNAYQSPTTERSFTKKRVPGDVTGRPLRLNLSVLYDGVNDVIHDLAWHEYLIDTGHILHGSTMSQSNGIKQSIKEYYGTAFADEIEQWRNDIALGDRGVGTPAWFTALTRNVGLAAMGYSLTTAAAQATGVGYAIPQTGVPAFLKAMAKYMVHPLSTRRKINEQSDAMRLRAQTQFKELAQIRNRLERGKGTIPWMQEHAFILTELVQGFADTVSWQAAYERFSRDGFEGDKLIKMCDQVVVSTQASGNIHDLSRFEREKSYAKIFGVFYSWMNAALNLSVAEYFGETNKFKKIANLFFMCVLMPYIEQSFKDALVARGDDDDDDDKDAVDKYVREPLADVAEYNLGQFMYLRELSNTASQAIKGEPIFGYSGPAGLRTFKIGNESIANLAKLAQTIDDPNYDRIIKNIIDVAGASIGAPSTQVKRTIKGLKAIDQGKVEGIDAIKAPLFGYKGRVD